MMKIVLCHGIRKWRVLANLVTNVFSVYDCIHLLLHYCVMSCVVHIANCTRIDGITMSTTL